MWLLVKYERNERLKKIKGNLVTMASRPTSFTSTSFSQQVKTRIAVVISSTFLLNKVQ